MNTLFIMLQAAAQESVWMSLLPMVLIIVVFYFFMIRPQMKRQKEMMKFRNALQKGDKIVTTGGIYGKVDEVQDTFVIMNVGGDVKMKVDKSAIIRDMSDAAK